MPKTVKRKAIHFIHALLQCDTVFVTSSGKGDHDNRFWIFHLGPLVLLLLNFRLFDFQVIRFWAYMMYSKFDIYSFISIFFGWYLIIDRLQLPLRQSRHIHSRLQLPLRQSRHIHSSFLWSLLVFYGMISEWNRLLWVARLKHSKLLSSLSNTNLWNLLIVLTLFQLSCVNSDIIFNLLKAARVW